MSESPANPVSDPRAAAATAQPAGSNIVFMPAADSLTFMVPRTGFRGVALFFLMFSMIWDGITFIVAAAFIVDFIRHPNIESALVLAFLSIFVAIGVLMALAAVQTAFRKAVILATRDSLVYTQSGPIRNLEYQWKAGEIATIRTDYSGTTINNRRLRELQVTPKNSEKRGFFDGRDDTELEWMAALLRDFYGLTSPPPAESSQA
jgi:hypothetical protein